MGRHDPRAKNRNRLILQPSFVNEPIVIGHWLQDIGTASDQNVQTRVGLARLVDGYGLRLYDYSTNTAKNPGKEQVNYGGVVLVSAWHSKLTHNGKCQIPTCDCQKATPGLMLRLLAITDKTVTIPLPDRDDRRFSRPKCCTDHGIEGYTIFVHATHDKPCRYECGTDCYLVRKKRGEVD